MNIGDQIRSRITTEEAARHYGFEIKRSNFIACPFHGVDHTASLKLFPDGGWRCFGCNRGGSVIDFVMELYGINFQQACLRLDSDFNLGLSNAPVDRRAVSAALERRKAEQREAARIEAEQIALDQEHRYWWEARRLCPCNHPLYVTAVQKLAYMDYLLLEQEITQAKSRWMK